MGAILFLSACFIVVGILGFGYWIADMWRSLNNRIALAKIQQASKRRLQTPQILDEEWPNPHNELPKMR
jgi:hypothetical protein